MAYIKLYLQRYNKCLEENVKDYYVYLFVACPSYCSDCTHAEGCTQCARGYYLDAEKKCKCKYGAPITKLLMPT